ncbi:MAG: alpha-L-rhamnosidase N-terminal domain-containing protein [Bacteroidales bacterium]|nr:alpha-L-rhamnosidase N-terminal domain-containing protein [Bacteroidales bacterium]
MGVYDAFINGKEVKEILSDGTEMDDVFSPGWTNYNDYLYYRAYDVTSYIDNKDLAIGVRLGTGWYAGIIGRAYYGGIGEKGINELSLLAELAIEYVDGSTEIITSNTTDWVASENGPILSNDFFAGEVYDSRLEANIKGWDNSGFNAQRWSQVKRLDYKPKLVGGNENTAYMLEEYRIDPKESD